MPSRTRPRRRHGRLATPTVLVLLAGLVAVGLVALRPAATDERPRRPTDDGEVLERVVPRALALDGGAPAAPDAGTDAGEGAP